MRRRETTRPIRATGNLKHNIQVQGDIEAQGTGAMESIGKMKDDIAKMQHQVDILNDIKVTRAKLGGDFAPTNTSTTITMDGGETVVTKEADFATDLDELQGMLKDLEHQHALGRGAAGQQSRAVGRLRADWRPGRSPG